MDRKVQLIEILKKSDQPLKGSELATQLGISRQTLVQDIALLRKDGQPIISTTLGYVLEQLPKRATEILGIVHSPAELKKELDILIAHHVEVVDVIIDHPVYGRIKSDLNIRTPKDVKAFVQMRDQSPLPLFSEVTGGLHYHTLVADEQEYITDAKAALITAGLKLIK